MVERDDENDRDMENTFLYEKNEKTWTVKREMNKRETVKLAKVMIAVKKSRMGIFTLFLRVD